MKLGYPTCFPIAPRSPRISSKQMGQQVSAPRERPILRVCVVTVISSGGALREGPHEDSGAEVAAGDSTVAGKLAALTVRAPESGPCGTTTCVARGGPLWPRTQVHEQQEVVSGAHSQPSQLQRHATAIICCAPLVSGSRSNPAWISQRAKPAARETRPDP